jgi:hypothetical protein
LRDGSLSVASPVRRPAGFEHKLLWKYARDQRTA